MLVELYVKNFAVIEDLQLKLGPGLTVLSGDEGAGKSLVIEALGLLLGARAPLELIRSGAQAARVEGVFCLPSGVMEHLEGLLRENGVEPEADGTLILCRELLERGRSVARANGRAVPASLLRQIGQCLVDIHSQMEHLSVLDNRRQLDLLDAHGKLMELRRRLATTVDELRRKARELSSLRAGDEDRHRQLLQYQVEEIERANLTPGEEETLQGERRVLRRAQALREGCLTAYSALYDQEGSATALIHEALTALRKLSDIDSALSPHGELLEEAAVNLEETARELRRYSDGVEARAARLEEVEQRLDLLNCLKRKYGPGIEDMLAYGARARAELEALEGEQERVEVLERERERLESEAGALAAELSRLRGEAAGSLTGLVNQELADLGLPWARFDISLSQEEDPEGLPLPAGGNRLAFTRDGIDRVEFLVATNPGEPMKPLAAVASGGETCRIMLAFKSALKRADPSPTLVFDEIDVGVGGRSGDSVGRKLAELARYHQVLCVTHLPQIACFGDSHLRVFKETASGRASTGVELVEGGRRLEELAEMLGSPTGGQPMMEGAGELLGRARAWKTRERERVPA